MPVTWQTVRVLISSTFRDMHAERDHLVTVVLPELRERAEQLGLEFFDVDLRWGVPAKDLNGETANSWEYCRQWIDRVEPFFVCLLGQILEKSEGVFLYTQNLLGLQRSSIPLAP